MENASVSFLQQISSTKKYIFHFTSTKSIHLFLIYVIKKNLNTSFSFLPMKLLPEKLQSYYFPIKISLSLSYWSENSVQFSTCSKYIPLLPSNSKKYRHLILTRLYLFLKSVKYLLKRVLRIPYPFLDVIYLLKNNFLICIFVSFSYTHLERSRTIFKYITCSFLLGFSIESLHKM